MPLGIPKSAALMLQSTTNSVLDMFISSSRRWFEIPYTSSSMPRHLFTNDRVAPGYELADGYFDFHSLAISHDSHSPGFMAASSTAYALRKIHGHVHGNIPTAWGKEAKLPAQEKSHGKRQASPSPPRSSQELIGDEMTETTNEAVE